MTRATAHTLAVPAFLLALGLPGCGSDSPATPTRAVLVQGQMTFPRPEGPPMSQPLFGVVNFATAVRGDLEVSGDWSSASNSFIVSIRQGTCGIDNVLDCAVLAQEAAGPKPARATLSNASAGSYTLFILVAPTQGTLVPDTVTYQVFLTS